MKKPITLILEGFPNTTVPAICRGDWGLHATCGGTGRWSISHIPTGVRLVTISSCFYVRKCFREIARQNYQWDGQGEVPAKFVETFKPIAFKYLGE